MVNNILQSKVKTQINNIQENYNPVIKSDTVLEKNNNKKIQYVREGIYLEINKTLSEFDTDLKKQLARQNLDVLDSQTSINPNNHPYQTEDYPEIKNVKEALDRLFYKDLHITKLTINPKYAEKGSTINKVDLEWDFDKKIISQSINSEALGIDIRTYTDNSQLSDSKQYLLKASDGIVEVEKSIQLIFTEGKYYGVFPNDPTSEDIISNFTLSFTLNKGSSFQVNSGEGQYIYLLIPKSIGNIQFSVNGFDGGFQIVNDNYQFHKFGKTFQCILYRSDYPNLGNTTVNIK